MADESERKRSTHVVDATVVSVPELGGTAGREERKRAAHVSGRQQVAAGNGACETDSDSKRPSFEGFCARDYLDQYWPPQEPMDDEDKFMQHFLHQAFTDHPDAAGGLMLDVGSAAVVDKLLTAAKHVQDIWLLEYLPQNRAEMLSWLEAEEGCFDWGKCVRYLCEHVADDDPKAVEDRVRAAVSYVGPVDLFDRDMGAVRPLRLLEAPPAGDHKCTVCGRLVAASAVDDRVGDTVPLGEGAATSGAGSGGADGAHSADSAGVAGSLATAPRAGESGPAPLKDSEFSGVRSGGVWRHKGPRPCRGCGLRPRVSVVSMHSVIECITKDKPQFAFVFDNALKLVTPHAGCLLIMTVNTNTKSWAGGKGRDFPAANIAVADVTDHLTARGFMNVRVTMHHGEAGTEMEETVGVTAVWPGPRRLTS